MAESDERLGGPQQYDAFISYRHVDRDRKWAEWLIEALERYRVPKSLQERGLPPRLRKIFRDEDEVPASSDLNDQIREALVASRFLIVVCSAFTPRSHWVAREIETFNELGRSDRVLALLTEGEPSDSFPAAMLIQRREVVDADGVARIVETAKEPLAADVRPRPGVSAETLKRMALLRLVSVILGVKFDDLRQRERERAGRRRAVWAAAAAAVVAAVVVGGAYVWDTTRPKTAYYRQLVWRWGLPEGAGPIDAATHGGLARSYAVVTRGGKVVEARHDGWIRAEADGAARWIVRYGDDGEAQKVAIFGPTGRLLRENVLKREGAGRKMIVGFERNGVPAAQDATQNAAVDLANAAPPTAQAKSDITRRELTFDESGFAVEVRYQDNWGTPQPDAQGSFGQRLAYSPDGLPLRSAEIGPDGEEITHANGVHAVVSTYDSVDRLVRQTLVGEDGKPINGPDGYAYYVRNYEAAGAGNDTAETYYGADGKPTAGGRGYAKLLGRFDDRGDNIEAAFYDADGKPTLHKDGYALLRRKFDERGDVIEVANFGLDGRPAFDTSGRAGYRQKFDGRGEVIEVDNFDPDGKPTLTKSGVATIKRLYDSRDNLVEEAYFGVDGAPTSTKDGVAVARQKFDQRDNRVGLAFFGASGGPTTNREKIASVVFAFDARGNEVERAFFGVDGESVVGIDGYAGFRQKFDDRGDLTERSFFGAEGAPALAKTFGAAAIRYRYDAHGRTIESAFYGVDGKPILAPGGYAILRSAYDERGNLVDLAFFGVDGKPKPDSENIARFKYVNDARGRRVEARFFGVDGLPARAVGGQSGFRQKFDDTGNIVEVSYFGPAGEPVRYALGYASYRQKFDDRRNRIELAYFGLNGEPVPSREAIARTTDVYDARGNAVERAFFGADGKPTLGFGGFARYVRTFDARDNLLSVTYFGVDGKPTAVRDGGYAKVVWTYDARGDLTTESYFGPDGAPSDAGGCAAIRYSYDEQGRQTKVAYLDAENREAPMALVVRSLVPGGLGAQIGLAAGDRIVSYNGQAATSTRRLSELTPGTGFRTLVVRRGSRTLTFDVWAGGLGVYLGFAPVEPAPAPSGGAASAP